MEKAVRVLQVIGIMNRGGAEAMIMNLYRNIDRDKIQFDFVENTYAEAVFDEEIRKLGGTIFHCPHFNGKNYVQYKKWWKNFFEEHKGEYQIVHGHIGSTAAIYLKEAKKSGVYAIAHSHNSGTDHSIKSFLYNVISYPTRDIADYFFACSEVAGKDRFGKCVTESSNYRVIHNAIDTSEFRFRSEIRKKTREQLNIGEETAVIGHIGRFDIQKNHKFLVEIMKAVKDRKQNTIFLFVGDGELRPMIEKLVKEKKIEKNCIFLGVRNDVQDLIQAMDLLVFPSLHEGLPVTLVETQTAGLPCGITDKVPKESILTENLVSVMSLEDSAEIWADHIIGRLGEKRYDRSEEIVKAGYDISATAKWLEEFYLEKYEQN